MTGPAAPPARAGGPERPGGLRYALMGGHVVAEGIDGRADVGIGRSGRIEVLSSPGRLIAGEATGGEGRAVADEATGGEGRAAIAGEGRPAAGDTTGGEGRLVADETIDCEGLIVVPGVVDAHTHLRAPGFPEREDLQSGTTAALAGGVTSVIEMPMADTGTRTSALVASRQALFERESHVDFGFIGAGGRVSAAEVDAMAAAGVLGFKAYLRSPPAGREDSFAGSAVTDERGLGEVVRAVAATGLPWLVHADHESLQACADPRFRAMTGARDEAAALAETQGTHLALSYARLLGASLHVVHVTCAEALAAIDRARATTDVTAEAILPHLALVAADEERVGALARVSPPAKSEADREALWAAVASGAVCNIASDHSARSAEECAAALALPEPGRMSAASIEHLLPLALTLAEERGLWLREVLPALTSRPARRFGLWPRKGSLAVGADADVVLLERRTERITGADMRSKARHTPYEGRSVGFAVRGVFSRGRLAYSEGRVLSEPGAGTFLRR